MKTSDIINGFCELVFRDRKGNKIYPNVFVEKWEADLLEVTRSRLTYEYEVKVSRCDFHKDSKKQDQNGNSKFDNISAGGRTNYFYYIVPDGLVKPEEVPEFAGLIYAINGTRRADGYTEPIIYFHVAKAAQKVSSTKADNKFIDKLNLSAYYRFHKLRRINYLKESKNG